MAVINAADTRGSLAVPGNDLQSGELGVSSSRGGQVAIGAGLVLATVLIALLLGVGQYASRKRALIGETELSAAQFMTIFRQAAEARLQSLRLGAEVLSRDRQIGEALADRDRPALAAQIQPLFSQALLPRFEVSVLDFQEPDGVMFYRAHRPELFGDDASTRKTVRTALKGREPISGLEVGRSGPELRAMTPVIFDGTLVGSLELGSGVLDPLQAAARATGLGYGFAVDEKLSESLGRPYREDTDLQADGALFFAFDAEKSRRELQQSGFNPRLTRARLLESDSQSLFVETFPINDVNGQPVARVSVLRDLRPELAEARLAIALRTGLGALAAVAVLLIAQTQYRRVREGVTRSFTTRLQALRDKAAAYDRLNASVGDFAAWQRGFVSEVVLLLGHPLRAAANLLAVAEHDLPAGQARAQLTTTRGLLDRLAVVLDDQAEAAAIRGGWHPVEIMATDLVALARDVLEERGVASYPDRLECEADEMRVLADPKIVRAALRVLVAGLRATGSASITLALGWEGSRAVGRLTTGGSWTDEAPTFDPPAALFRDMEASGPTGLVAARAAFERLAGGLDVITGPAGVIGFRFVLPGAGS